MHMADALLSPAVGGTMWAAAAATITYSSVKLKKELDSKKIPLMGVLGAFIFAAQMINFTIPGTGSSGHLGGGMILVILLGPAAGFLTIASVLVIQALFFADGGLLALGSNIINLGLFPCFLAYPLIYRPLRGSKPYSARSILAVILSTVVAMQLGALGVVLETLLSGRSALDFGKFLLLMQPVHLAISLVEALITLALVNFLWKARPDLLETARAKTAGREPGKSFKPVIIGLVILTLVTGGIVSWFASANPDGLEWALFRTTGSEEPDSPQSNLHTALADVQQQTALLPDYDFKQTVETSQTATGWPAVNAGTTVSGIIGAGVTLCLVTLAGILLKLKRKKPADQAGSR